MKKEIRLVIGIVGLSTVFVLCAQQQVLAQKKRVLVGNASSEGCVRCLNQGGIGCANVIDSCTVEVYSVMILPRL